MTELKTLKDLKWKSPEIYDRIILGILPKEINPKNDWFICEGNLKAEAVKWWKFWDKMEPIPRRMPKLYIQGRKQALVDFFNLTVEDLK